MGNWLLVYTYLSAGIMLNIFYNELYHSDNSECYMSTIKEFAKMGSISEKWALAITFLIAGCCGWFLFPVWIFYRILNRG